MKTGKGDFRNWNKDELKAVASKAGKSLAPEKRAFSLDPELARRAGKKSAERYKIK